MIGGISAFSFKDFGKNVSYVAKKTCEQTFTLVDFAKMAIADIQFVSYFSGSKNPESFIGSLKKFTDFGYAARAPFEFIQDVTSKGVPFSFVRYSKDDKIDLGATLIKLGGVFETANYLKKNGVCDFNLVCGWFSKNVGSIEIFSTNEKKYIVANTPILELFVNAPNLFFYFTGSLLKLKDLCVDALDNKNITTERLLKDVAPLGRVASFGLIRYVVANPATNPFVLTWELGVKNIKYLCDIISINKEFRKYQEEAKKEQQLPVN